MTLYNWQQTDWPSFRYDLSEINNTLFLIAEKKGLINGKLAHLNHHLQEEAMLNLMIEEAIKTSEIEGEFIPRPDVRSSIRNKLGLNSEIVRVHDKRAQGIVDLMFDVHKTFKKPLSKSTLFNWHLMLMSSALNPNLRIGSWRIQEEPMQVVSGNYNKWIVHFEAPPSEIVPQEMEKFIRWFNSTAPDKPNALPYASVRAAIAHLYFESIHPFDDGNGRIGRAIAEKALSQGFGYPVMLSLSQAIEVNKKAYYSALKSASRSNEITEWIKYFVNIILQAQMEVETQINFILNKSHFYDKFETVLSARELKVIHRLMETGTKGFEGGISAKKYMTIADVSKATATRDLQHLHEIKALKQIGSGRNIRYELNFDDVM